MEAYKFIPLLHESVEGRYTLTGQDLQELHDYLCDLKVPKPSTCPVCGGNGMVPNGFYNQFRGQWLTSSATPEMCRSCTGSGVVWPPN